jgi:P4 family phage/plasmid primase-like protien
MKTTDNSKSESGIDPVFEKYGMPFLKDDKGKVRLNERAVAVKCATDNMVKYDPAQKKYQRFNFKGGIWTGVQATEVSRMISDLMLDLAKEPEQEDLVQRSKASQLNSVAKMLQPYQAAITLKDAKGFVHVNNGVVDLGRTNPKLLKHDPKYAFRVTSAIDYDAKAKCPKFLKQLLEPALGQEDIAVVQKYCGSMLLGENLSQGILILRGTPGGGKSTLVSIIEKMIGEANVAHLQTKHLNGRFETSAFIGKRLLVGKDVPGDTLAESGARMLKSLVGGDRLQAEIKYARDKQAIQGDYHVIIATNNRLRIALDGDEGAWKRRLLVVDFEKEQPTNPISNFADKLFEEEAAGILNWLIDGAMAIRKEMKSKGKIALSEEQQQRIAALLEGSDSVRSFVEKRLIKADGRDVSSEELLREYYVECKKQNWPPVGEHAFQKRLPDMVLERYTVVKRNDVIRAKKAVRGFKHLALV